MRRKKKSSKSKKMVGIRCQCQDRAVEREGSQLREIRCQRCGKIFKTNRDANICFSCEKRPNLA